TLTDAELGFELAYPTVGGAGHPVAVRIETTERGRRLHLTTADGAIYLELVRIRGITAEAEYAGHRPALEARFGAETVGELGATDLNGMAALGYRFGGDGIERTVLLVPIDGDLCRIVTDPRSAVNARILETLRRVDHVDADPGADGR